MVENITPGIFWLLTERDIPVPSNGFWMIPLYSRNTSPLAIWGHFIMSAGHDSRIGEIVTKAKWFFSNPKRGRRGSGNMTRSISEVTAEAWSIAHSETWDIFSHSGNRVGTILRCFYSWLLLYNRYLCHLGSLKVILEVLSPQYVQIWCPRRRGVLEKQA